MEGLEPLKSCPFCGSDAVFNEFTYKSNYSCAVNCSNNECRCGVIHTIHSYKSKEEAIKAWNKRIEDK